MGNFITFVFFVAVYAYISFSLQTIADRLNEENSWLAWVPFGNGYIMCKCGRKPGWWFLLFMIPLVGLIFAALVWINICNRLGKSPWLLLLFLVPLLNFALIGYLAFG